MVIIYISPKFLPQWKQILYFPPQNYINAVQNIFQMSTHGECMCNISDMTCILLGHATVARPAKLTAASMFYMMMKKSIEDKRDNNGMAS